MSAKKQISDLLDLYYKSLFEKDWNTFANCLGEGFNYYTDNAATLSRENFIEFMSKDNWKGISQDVSDVQISLSKDESMGFAIYQASFHGISGGEHEMKFTARETTLFSNVSGEWKIIHTHTSNKM